MKYKKNIYIYKKMLYNIYRRKVGEKGMYVFKKEAREDVLKGRTIRYVAINDLMITEVYLSNILNGIKGCSYRLARDICKYISPEASIEKYFIKRR